MINLEGVGHDCNPSVAALRLYSHGRNDHSHRAGIDHPHRRNTQEINKLLAAVRPPLNNPALVGYLANDEETKQIEQVCKQFINGKPSISDLTVGDDLECTAWTPVSTPYKRAIAKIAFHFLLQWFPQFTGREPEFNDIKRFIYHGHGNPDQIVEAITAPIVKLAPEQRVLMWGHLVCCEYDSANIETRIQFFIGPQQAQPLVWRVMIGKNPSRLAASGYKCLHFRYYDAKRDGYDGEIVELEASRIISV